MVVFLLLVIVAILLLGSSAFIGIVGALLGIAALIVAFIVGLSWLSEMSGISTEDLMLYSAVALLMLMLVAKLVVSHLDERRREQEKDFWKRHYGGD